MVMLAHGPHSRGACDEDSRPEIGRNDTSQMSGASAAAIMPSVANIAFSIGAGLGSLLITVLAATQGLLAVAVIWGMLAVAFAVRAELGRRRRR